MASVLNILSLCKTKEETHMALLLTEDNIKNGKTEYSLAKNTKWTELV